MMIVSGFKDFIITERFWLYDNHGTSQLRKFRKAVSHGVPPDVTCYVCDDLNTDLLNVEYVQYNRHTVCRQCHEIIKDIPDFF